MFAAVRQSGATFPSGGLLLGVRDREEESRLETRFGFVTPKYLGGAVQRNLVGRRLKDVVIAMGDTIPQGYDIVIVARRSAATTSFSRLARDFWKAAVKAKLVSRAAEVPAQRIDAGRGGK